jgi:hypothetical protein
MLSLQRPVWQQPLQGAGMAAAFTHLRAGGQGWVTVEESTAGIMTVLEDGRQLAGRFWSFDGSEIPW